MPKDGPPEEPPLPGGPIVGVPPMFTPGVLPGTDAGLGLPGTGRAGRSSMVGPVGTAPGAVEGALTPVLPAPPLGASVSAEADPASRRAKAALSAIVVCVMASSLEPVIADTTAGARGSSWV